VGLWSLSPAQLQEIWDAVEFVPTEGQRPILLCGKRTIGIFGGERGGKSQTSEMLLLPWIVQRPLDALFWIVGPDYFQARAEFEHLLPHLDRLDLLDAKTVSQPKNGPWECQTRLRAEGHLPTVVRTRSSTDVMSLASVAPDGILMVEAGQQEYEAYRRCMGRVAEKRGPIVISGTFESGAGWYADLFRSWQGDNEEGGRSFSLPSWSNTVRYPGGYDDPEMVRLRGIYPADVFQERFGGVPSKPSTLVFKEFHYSTHVKAFAEFDPELPVQLWIDPGYDHYYAVLAVQIRRDIDECPVYHFDEIYETGLVARKMIARAKEKPWWPNVQTIIMDVAGKAHPAADSQAEIWFRHTGIYPIMNHIRIADGILRHRTFLENPDTGNPRLFHNPRCKSVREYGLYKRRKPSETTAATETPIDQHNDAMKALAYGLVANFGHVNAPRPLPEVQVIFRSI